MSLTASGNWGAPQLRPPWALHGMRVQRRLGVFVAASLVLHAYTFGTYAPGAGGYPGTGDLAHPSVLETRLVREHIPVQTIAASDESGVDASRQDPDQTPPPAAALPKSTTGDAHGTVPMPAPERWYEAAELERRAQPLSPVELAYPAELAGMSAAPAKVRLRLFIDERGALRKLEVETSGPRPEFDEAAIRAWEAVRFSPAMKDGVTVKSQKLLEVAFAP